MGRPAFFQIRAFVDGSCRMSTIHRPIDSAALRSGFGWKLKRCPSASLRHPAFFAPDPLLLVSCTCCAAMSCQNGTMKRDF